MFKLMCIVFALLLRCITGSNEFLIWGAVLILMDIAWQNTYKEYKSNELPEKMYCCPRYFKFLFQHVGFNTENVPKLVAIHIYVFFGMMVLINILFVLIIMREPAEEFSRIDIMVGIAIIMALLEMFFNLFLVNRTTKICFLQKFKKTNKLNIKYLFLRSLFVEPMKKEPKAIFCGKCCVISKKKYKFFKKEECATVRMIKTEEVIEKVLLTGKKQYKQGETYRLYEICGVRYIE